MKLRDKVLARMIELAQDQASGWERIPSRVGGVTVRWTWTHETPEWARTHCDWREPTYHALTFLTQVGGSFIMGTSAGPWVGRNDQTVPLWLVEAILEDPDLSQDDLRMFEMKAARKAGRSGAGS